MKLFGGMNRDDGVGCGGLSTACSGEIHFVSSSPVKASTFGARSGDRVTRVSSDRWDRTRGRSCRSKDAWLAGCMVWALNPILMCSLSGFVGLPL